MANLRATPRIGTTILPWVEYWGRGHRVMEPRTGSRGPTGVRDTGVHGRKRVVQLSGGLGRSWQPARCRGPQV